MKRNPRVLFLCLLTSILFSPWLHSQPISNYPYGMYVYGNTGIYAVFNGNNVDHLEHFKNSSNESIIQVWNRNVNMNYFLIAHNYGSPDTNLRYLKNNYFPTSVKGKINYIYKAPIVTDLSETHYVKFDYVNAAKNAIVFPGSSPFEIYQTGGNYRVYSPNDVLAKSNAAALPPPTTRNSGYVVENLNVIGTYNNRAVIRPRTLNTTYNSDGTRYATFYVRVGIKNSNATNTSLTLAMTNGNPGPGNGYDSYNNGTFTKTVTLSGSSSLQYVILDFKIYMGPESSRYTSAYLYAPKLTINCSMDFGKSFDIESITLYDEVGLKVVEQNYMASIPRLTNFINEISSYTNVNDIQTLDLGDEPVIGNFQPTKHVIEYMRNMMPAGKTFKTSSTVIEMTNFNNSTEFNATMNRFFSEVNPDYYSPDLYVFDPDTSISYNYNIINELYTWTKNISDFIKNNNFSTKLISVLQLHKWKDGPYIQLREPSRNEMLSSAYVSILNGYKGILWWYSGPAQTDPYNRALYPYLAPSYHDWERPYNDYLFNTNNMVAYKKDAINKVASYLNFTSTTDLGTFVLGDLLNAGSFASSQIIGTQSNSATMALGDISRAQLYKVDIMNTDTWDVSTSENLIGVNYFSIPGDNAAYYLLTNLNKDGHACKVRLSFKTTNGANFLKNYVLTNTQDYGRLYSKNAVILADVPQDGINILRIVNTNTNEYNEFPKGSRFGVARTVNNITTINLDQNFSSQANVPEEVVINTNLNAEVISLYNKDASTGKIYTDFATFRVLNYSYNGTTSMQIEFKKYLQNNDGTFTAQSPATYIVPRPNAASTAYKVKSLSYDSDNDGVDEMGYCIAYNNRYFIYTFNGTGFTQRKVFPGSTPSAAPEYFNLDATVLAAKWGGYSTIYIYNPANHCFYMDKDRDLQINLTTEKQPMGNWFGSWSPMPYTGDWYGDATWEYGTYEFDKPYGYTQFNINHSHTDGWSWFEFPYGDGYPMDKPLVWKPRTLSAPKSAGETIEEAVEIPSEYSISQNFPNPFNPATTIRFALPAESRVTLEVFNILGERVAELVNDVRPAGTMDVRFDGSNLASGIYIYKFNATSLENGKHFQKINKMMLLK